MMPISSQTPCNKIGCSAISYGRYCERHAGSARCEEQRVKAKSDNRPAAHLRGYDRRWKVLRKRYAQAHPLCEDCKLINRLTPVAIVDHIIPVHAAPELRLTESNLRSLCAPHHASKTLKDKPVYGSASSPKSLKKATQEG